MQELPACPGATQLICVIWKPLLAFMSQLPSAVVKCPMIDYWKAGEMDSGSRVGTVASQAAIEPVLGQDGAEKCSKGSCPPQGSLKVEKVGC